GVALFESQFTSLQRACSRRISELFNRALLLKVFLSRHVQLSFRRQRCPEPCFPPRLLTAFISGAFFGCCAVSRAVSVEHCDATQDDRCQSHQHKQAQLPDHNSRQPQTNLSIYAAIGQGSRSRRIRLATNARRARLQIVGIRWNALSPTRWHKPESSTWGQ